MQRTELGVKEPIAVKLVMLGKSTQVLVRDPGTTLGDILTEHGVADRMEARVNGEPANPARRLADRDVVLLIPKIRGGAR